MRFAFTHDNHPPKQVPVHMFACMVYGIRVVCYVRKYQRGTRQKDEHREAEPAERYVDRAVTRGGGI